MGGANESANVVLDVPKKIRECLVKEGRLYVEFNSCRLREHLEVPQCYGCGSFEHLMARCKNGRLCNNCGEDDHTISACNNAAKCRNCSLGGLPAGHRVTSANCPFFMKQSERRRNFVIG